MRGFKILIKSWKLLPVLCCEGKHQPRQRIHSWMVFKIPSNPNHLVVLRFCHWQHQSNPGKGKEGAVTTTQWWTTPCTGNLAGIEGRGWDEETDGKFLPYRCGKQKKKSITHQEFSHGEVQKGLAHPSKYPKLQCARFVFKGIFPISSQLCHLLYQLCQGY